MTRKPDFMIIGALKCATSTLHGQLAVQEGVVMSMPHKPNFFSHEEHWARGLSWYWSLFARAGDADVCGESSTAYTALPTYPDVVSRVREHVPDAKFIYVMRNPLDRLVSHYIQAWADRVVTSSLTKAIHEYAPLVQSSQYAMQLEPWFAAFGKERVLPVFFEHMQTHPQAELERVCSFIGHRGRPVWKADLTASTPSSQRMRDSKLRNLLVYAPGMSMVRQRMPNAVRKRVKRLWTMKKRPELSEADVRRLEAVLNPDLDKLGQWLGIDGLSCSSFDNVTRDQVHAWV